MSNGIFIIAHAPLASALRQCVLHVFEECAATVLALDVPGDMPFDATVEQARRTVAHWAGLDVLLVTDVLGATPCNVAQQVSEGTRWQLLAGANVPMLLRAANYRHEPLETMAANAIAGGIAGVVKVGVEKTPAPDQCGKNHGKKDGDDQQ
ncbi:MAG: PTS fructose transporter subunit IIA [Burkholderiaceae bacterium]